MLYRFRFAKVGLVPGDRPFYSPTGHIVYEAGGGLWAMPFSLEKLQSTGESFWIRENASYASVSRDGAMIYLGAEGGLQQLIWKDRSGQKLGQIGQPQMEIEMPVLSPNGGRVVVQARDRDDFDVWVHDIARGIKSRLTFDSALEDAVSLVSTTTTPSSTNNVSVVAKIAQTNRIDSK